MNIIALQYLLIFSAASVELTARKLENIDVAMVKLVFHQYKKITPVIIAENNKSFFLYSGQGTEYSTKKNQTIVDQFVASVLLYSVNL